MYLHVYLLVEPFSTIRAEKWPVVGVSAHVRVQVGRPVERFAALSADVRFHLNIRRFLN